MRHHDGIPGMIVRNENDITDVKIKKTKNEIHMFKRNY